MPRLDTERQNLLEPKRITFAKQQIEKLGYEITYQDSKEIHFIFEGQKIVFFPYSGWHTGKSIQDGRGINHLLKQINEHP